MGIAKIAALKSDFPVSIKIDQSEHFKRNVMENETSFYALSFVNIESKWKKLINKNFNRKISV